ncbi:MAG: hypothetical protein B7Z52_00100, partial [Burkholderiales bacterium 12-64-5]
MHRPAVLLSAAVGVCRRCDPQVLGVDDLANAEDAGIGIPWWLVVEPNVIFSRGRRPPVHVQIGDLPQIEPREVGRLICQNVAPLLKARGSEMDVLLG